MAVHERSFAGRGEYAQLAGRFVRRRRTAPSQVGAQPSTEARFMAPPRNERLRLLGRTARGTEVSSQRRFSHPLPRRLGAVHSASVPSLLPEKFLYVRRRSGCAKPSAQTAVVATTPPEQWPGGLRSVATKPSRLLPVCSERMPGVKQRIRGCPVWAARFGQDCPVAAGASAHSHIGCILRRTGSREAMGLPTSASVCICVDTGWTQMEVAYCTARAHALQIALGGPSTRCSGTLQLKTGGRRE